MAWIKCQNCHGDGFTVVIERTEYELEPFHQDKPVTEIFGVSKRVTCSECKGRGQIWID